MAYGQEPLRPKRSDEKIKPLSYPETKKIQQGKTGLEGASQYAQPDFGNLPSSGNFEPNAGDSQRMKGGSTATGAMKGEGGRDRSSTGAQVIHHSSGGIGAAGKKPLHPGSKGGKGVGSVDTLTKLIFHPNGGLGHGDRHRPEKSGGFKDTGKATPKRLYGASPGKTTSSPGGLKANRFTVSRHSPEKSSGFKDSGAKGPPRVVSGVHK